MAVRAKPDNLSLEQPSAPAARAGDNAALEELWGHHAELQAVCLRMVGDPGKAEDLVQETYVRALQQTRARGLDRRDSFGPWLATVARRRAIDEIRWRRRGWEQATCLESRAATGIADDPVEQVLQQEVFDRIRVALGELSTRERQLLLRQVTHGLTLAELAEEEGASVASVRSVLSRARGKLRIALERGGPLGAAPAPKWVGVVRDRFHRLAARVEGALPTLAGGGAHFGDVVAAAIAAIVLLLGGTTSTTSPAGVDLTTALAQLRTVSSTTDGAAPIERDAPARAGAAVGASSSPADSGWAGQPTPPMLPAPLDIPSLPDDGASQPELSTVTSLTASEDGSVVYASGSSWKGFQFAVFRSTDRGASWQKVGIDGFTSGRIILPPTYPASPTLFAVSDYGLQRSENHGGDFVTVAPARNVAALSPGYASGDRRIVLALPHLATYSVDDPVVRPHSRMPFDTQAEGMVVLPSFAQDGAVLIGSTARDASSTKVRAPGAVYRCRLGDCSDVTVLPSTRSGVNVMAGSGAVIAWTSDALFRSDDDAKTFTAVPIPQGLDIKQVVSGTAGELLLAATNYLGPKQPGILRSTDGGRTWLPLGRGTPIEQGAYSVVRLQNGPLIAGVVGGGVLCSVDDGRTWHRRCT